MKKAFLKEEVKAGMIIVSALAILTLFIVLIGGRQFFEKIDSYYVHVMNTAGLEPGAQVRLGGVRVGRIVDIMEPKAAGEPVTIKIGIKKGTKLYKGTRAFITQIGFVGDIYLLLSINNTIAERIDPGENIPSQEKVDFDVMMSKVEALSNSLDGLIKDIDKLFSPENRKRIEDLLSNTDKAIVSSSLNLAKVTEGLKDTTDKLGLVLTEVHGLVRDNKGEVAELIKKAREDLDKAGIMIESFEKASKSVDRAVEFQSQNLDELLGSMTRTTEELKEVIQEIKAKPWSFIYKEGDGE